MKTHELKTDSEVFEAVVSSRKTYEIRKNDRDFKVGDLLNLRETQFTGAEMLPQHNGCYPGEWSEGKPLVYTGRQVTAEVTHILQGPIYGLVTGWALLSIRLLPTVSVPRTYEQGAREMRERVCQVIHKEAWMWVNSSTVGVEICNRLEKTIRALPLKEKGAEVCEWVEDHATTREHRENWSGDYSTVIMKTECGDYHAKSDYFKCCPYCGKPIKIKDIAAEGGKE